MKAEMNNNKKRQFVKNRKYKQKKKLWKYYLQKNERRYFTHYKNKIFKKEC